MDVKFGKIKPNNSNIFMPSLSTNSDANFFATKPEIKQDNKNETIVQGSRINDFDSNILENNAYQNISDEMFKIEHKMEMLEQSLFKIDEEIDALQSLGYNDQIIDLIERKRKIKEELSELNKKYCESGLSAKLSGQIASAVSFSSDKKTNNFSKIKNFISRKILSKISKKFNYNQNMKDALEKLSNINSSVDELVKLQVPYGETIKRYEKLTAYLNKANVIHSQMTKNMNSFSKKKA